MLFSLKLITKRAIFAFSPGIKYNYSLSMHQKVLVFFLIIIILKTLVNGIVSLLANENLKIKKIIVSEGGSHCHYAAIPLGSTQ